MTADTQRQPMYDFLASVLAEIGPRESCSESERQLGRRLASLWSELRHEVRTERFACHPKAFLGCIPIVALLYLAAIVFYWFLPFVCFLLAATAVAIMFFEQIRYREFVDRFFPEQHGENVVAVIRPREQATRRVVVSAHQDSAYEFNLWYFLGNAAIPLQVISLLALLVPMLGGLAKSLVGAEAGPGFDVIGYVGFALYPIVGLNLFFHTYTPVPGAMDDLAGIAVLTGLARALSEGAGDELALRNTEVLLLAASSEEAGLRGAKRFVAAHKKELTETPTYGIFLDGIYDERLLAVMKRELATGARHDPRLIDLAKRVAAERGWPIREGVVPFGGTDGAAFALAGVPSVALLAQDISRLPPNYHTRRDVIDHVRPESLTVMLQLVIDMIRQIDAGNGPFGDAVAS